MSAKTSPMVGVSIFRGRRTHHETWNKEHPRRALLLLAVDGFCFSSTGRPAARFPGRDRPEAQHPFVPYMTEQPQAARNRETPWNPGVGPPVSLTLRSAHRPAAPPANGLLASLTSSLSRPHHWPHRHGGSVKPLRRGAKPRAQTHRHIHPSPGHEQRVGGEAELRDDK